MTRLAPEEVAERRHRGVALEAEHLKHEDPPLRCAVLGSFNLDLLPPLLVEALDRAGIRSTVYKAGFGQVAEEILDPGSGLYAAAPDAVVIVPAVEDALAPVYAGSVDPGEGDAFAEERAQDLQALVSAVLERLPAATCFVVVFGASRAPLEAVLSPGSTARGQAAVGRFVSAVRALGEVSPRAIVVDWDWRERTTGTLAYRDERLWYLGRMRLNPIGAAALADVLALHVAAARGTPRKVAAVDIDDTLWGGIVGEVGLGGIVLGEEGIGLAFQDFQRELLRLRGVGVVLALCSRNNPDDVWEVFERHPAMVLRREHFVAERVNWQDKATNLRELAEELNLGIDSFVFLDDNPVERSWVRQALPDVLVPELPTDVTQRPSYLAAAPFFARLDVTEADRGRPASYAAEKRRRAVRTQAASFEDFLASLEQEITVAPVTEATVSRAAQLTQRTNQFNLTTRRYSVAEIESMLADEDVELYTLSVRDRFADSGIVGLAVVRYRDEEAEIDTLLLSCRVLGRRVEDAFLSVLADAAGRRGARVLTGRYVPTAKNGQVARLYPDRGFAEVEPGQFQVELAHVRLESPEQIALNVVAHA